LTQKETESSGVKSTIDPSGKRSTSGKPRMKARVDANGVIHLDEEDNIRRTYTSDDRKIWQLEQLNNTQRSSKSYHKRKSLVGGIASDRETSSQQKVEPRETKVAIAQDLIVASSQYNGLKSRSDSTLFTNFDSPNDSSEIKDTAPYKHPFTIIDAREAEDNFWSLEEEKRSELDQIRRKKLDREEALVRIRAIKARIAKLEI
jgi:uncharacterized membrane protein YgaE (UPF0421/DUF939 family)